MNTSFLKPVLASLLSAGFMASSATAPAGAATIPWSHDLDAAVKTAAAEHKQVLIEFYFDT